MTVKELIEQLQSLNEPDLEVFTLSRDGEEHNVGPYVQEPRDNMWYSQPNFRRVLL